MNNSVIIESGEDSDVGLNTGRKRKLATIEDDEEPNLTHVSETSISNDEKENKDEIGVIAFGEHSVRLEENLKRLKNQFPTVDEMELQDVLVSSSNMYLQACCKIRNSRQSLFARNRNRRVNLKEENAGVWLSKGRSANGTHQSRSIPLKTYKTASRKVLSSDESNDDVKIFNKNTATKNKSSKGNKQKRHRINDTDDFIVLSSEESDSNEETEDLLASDVDSENYEEDELVSDSEGEVEDVKQLSREPTRKLTYRTKILELLNNGVDVDLLTIPTVSQKKLQLLKDLRPIANWDDLIFKLENNRTLSTDILSNVMTTVKSRDVVSKLMAESERMADKVSMKISPSQVIKQPKVLNSNYKLTSYQLYGVTWLLLLHDKHINAILADEMGLGKTIQVIALLASLYERGIEGPHLVVVPASTLENWVREFETWCPKFKLLLYYGSQDDRAAIRADSRREKYDVMVTTYSMLNNNDDKKMFRRTTFTYVVFDEAHMLKNMKSIRYNNLLEVKGRHRLLLTGTPLQNDLLELMSLLVFTMPSLFLGEINHIKSLFACSRQNSQTSFEKERIMQAKKILKPFILRRLKVEVLKDLPSKTEFVEKCQMTSSQEEQYMSLIEKYAREIRYSKKGATKAEYNSKYGTFKGGQGMIMELRKAANHPLLRRVHYNDSVITKMAHLMLKEPTHSDANPDYIFEDMSYYSDFELHKLCLKFPSINKFKLDENFILDSGKFKKLDEMLPKLIEDGKRILLFSQFVIVLDIIEEYLKIRSYKFLRLDGSTKVAERLGLIDEFSDDQSIPIFLLSTRAGGLGINLTAAQVVIIHDIDFNPYNDKQAEDRCHRVGQTKDVFIYRFISENTVEEGMLSIGEEKLKLGQEICASDAKAAEEQEQKDVKNLLRQALQI